MDIKFLRLFKHLVVAFIHSLVAKIHLEEVHSSVYPLVVVA